MQNMVVLIDTNILLAFHTLSTLWYVLRKKNDKERRGNLRDICTIFSVVSASKAEIIDAIEKDSFADFEDCLQDKCAKEAGADYIITVNEKDFTNSEIEAMLLFTANVINLKKNFTDNHSWKPESSQLI